MQTPTTVRGYSDFFASGFRAVTTRRSTSSRNSLETIPTNAWFSSSRERRTRTRPASMIVHTSVTSSTREKSQGRRSSFVSFSSRLFDRILSTSTAGDKNSPISSRRSSKSSQFFGSRSSGDSAPEVWISAGGPSAPNGSALHQSIDPFTSSPDARSMFIDLSSDESSPSGTPKRESFLSLTGSSSNRSSFIFARRERPTSIHTMPLPSRSRRSSLQYCPPSLEKTDFFLILEEEPSLATEPIPEDHDEWDAPAKIDWRQFHIDILTDDNR
ncbi:hypothetical protein GALMADRAFT_243971 [Galerina marginata CBS 339.88]|uniref:Uncharacterized protein n=1 Tax=Galerina marginata (strain CBS 339.88) TaxID=685588 RepID=A0A067T881_GALM3|nr:hypothetical protein GALMADRAFT_243971 [Galerina marginata CBS 339.88]